MTTCDNSRPKGAILFAVINGKVSEGINFSNHYGRAVIVVGLPFPNQSSPEISEMIKFLSSTPNCKISSSTFLENACMRSVNQAIGRVIRNMNDYATIVLLDCRYSQENIVKKLPKWILPSLRVCKNFGDAYKGCVQFFKSIDQMV
ncbi:ATP-dependent DNA helicase chl1 [Mitosporidium daphniae]